MPTGIYGFPPEVFRTSIASVGGEHSISFDVMRLIPTSSIAWCFLCYVAACEIDCTEADRDVTLVPPHEMLQCYAYAC